MKQQLAELIGLLSSGALEETDIATIVDQVMAAVDAPDTFLANNPDIYFEEDFPLPLWEWVLLNELPAEVLFNADNLVDLYQQLMESFGDDAGFELQPDQLDEEDPLLALEQIQNQIQQFGLDHGGYTLIDFSQSLGDDIQVAMVYAQDLPRIQQLCDELGIYVAASDEALRDLLDEDDEGDDS